jgi:hypothetical protein
LTDTDDITNLVNKNANLVNTFAYSWNYTKVTTINKFANNVDFLMRANVVDGGTTVRFVDYLNKYASTNPYLDQLNTLVITNNIQNATNTDSNQGIYSPGFTKAFSNYYYRTFKIYPRVLLKTPNITSTAQNNLLTQRTIIYNNSNVIN